MIIELNSPAQVRPPGRIAARGDSDVHLGFVA